MHYEIYVKFLDNSFFIKMVYCLLDFIHLGIMGMLGLLLLNFNCDMNKLMILNIFIFIFITQFFIFKRCFFTIVENKILGVDDNTGPISRETRLKYFLDVNKVYKPKVYIDDIKQNTIDWMNSNMKIIIVTLILNIFCYYRYYLKK
jgi:hypothetical protein